MKFQRVVVWYDLFDSKSDDLMRIEGFVVNETRRSMTIAQISKPTIVLKNAIVKIQELDDGNIVKL